MPNKPNRPPGEIPHHSTVPASQHSRPVVRNKANSHHRADREIGVPGGAIVRNKANLQGAEMAANYRSEQGLGEKCAENAREKTKPISTIVPIGRSAFPGRFRPKTG